MRNIRICCICAFLVVLPQLARSEVAFSCTPPVALNEFLASFGANTHMQQGWQYADAAKTVATLKALGITQIREAFTGLGHPGLEYAARQGIKFDFFIAPNWGKKAIAALESWETTYPGSILSIEGPNEVNNWPVNFAGKTGIPAAQAFQQDLYDGVHGSPILKHIPVVALTSWPVFPNKSDIGNIHAYSRTGAHLSPDIKSAMEVEAIKNPPAKRIWLTEAGYHTLVGGGYFEGVSENTQAKLIVSLFLDAFAQGVEKTFLYQLADQYTDPHDQQSFFGLVDLKWRPKPSYNALRDTIAILNRFNEGDRKETLHPLAFAIDGLPSTARHILFQANNGDRVLAIWNEAAIWNNWTHQEIQSPAVDLALKFGRTWSEVRIFDPFFRTEARKTETNVDTVKLALEDRPLFITVRDASKETQNCDSSLGK
jgi:hypothetical protein